MAIAKNIAKRPKRYVPWRQRPNVAKRARALGIMKRKGLKPLTKAEARKLCDEIARAMDAQMISSSRHMR